MTVVSVVKNVIVPAGAIIALLASLFAGVRYIIKSEVSDIRGDVDTLKKGFERIDRDSAATGHRIDDLLREALQRAWPQPPPPTASKAQIRGSLEQANEMLHIATLRSVSLPPQLIANYGNSVIPMTEDPKVSDLAWKTIDNLLAYRTVLNASLAPDKTGHNPNHRVDFMVDIDYFRIDNAPANFGWLTYDLPQDRGLGAALFLKIGDESKVSPDSPHHIKVEATGYKLMIDGRHIRNANIYGAVIVYRGGPLVLENVYFVNCTFELQRSHEGKEFASAMLSHVPATFKSS